MDSTNTPAPSDRAEIQRYIAAMQYCFTIRNDWYAVHVPAAKPIAVRAQAADLGVLADLADGKITYGEANVRLAAIYTDTEAAYAHASK